MSRTTTLDSPEIGDSAARLRAERRAMDRGCFDLAPEAKCSVPNCIRCQPEAWAASLTQPVATPTQTAAAPTGFALIPDRAVVEHVLRLVGLDGRTVLVDVERGTVKRTSTIQPGDLCPHHPESTMYRPYDLMRWCLDCDWQVKP